MVMSPNRDKGSGDEESRDEGNGRGRVVMWLVVIAEALGYFSVILRHLIAFADTRQ
jgi:hypothetical protein